MTEPFAALPAILRLCSPSLPTGAFAYSGGLESAVDAGWVVNESDACAWILGLLQTQLATVDLPLLLRLCQARAAADREAFERWQQVAWACRETEELRAQDAHQGAALRRLLVDLDTPSLDAWLSGDCGWTAAFAISAHAWGISPEVASMGFAWSFCEAQVHAAVRLVPLGQTSGQRILGRVMAVLPQIACAATQVADEDIGTSLPGLAIASSWHPSQYSRLFRS